MKRFHALEWEDLDWFPTVWRDFGTDFIGFIATKFDIYKCIVPVLKKGLESSGQNDWIDCASGGGASLLKLAEHLKDTHPDLRITMTDYFPNMKAFEYIKSKNELHFNYSTSSVNAMDVPQKFHKKFRTMFGSFHHFRPENAQKIMQNAVDTKSPIAVFEPVGRNFMSWFSMLFVIPQVLLFAPFIRPFRIAALPFIYLIPIIPLYVLWDGIASIFRTYSKQELEKLVANLTNTDSFEWEIGSKKQGPSSVSYLIGTPKK